MTKKKLKDNCILMTEQEYSNLHYQYFSRKRKRKVCKTRLMSTIDGLKPKHIKKESWETFSYTTRHRLIEEHKLDALREQQRLLFERLKAEAEAEGRI